MPIKPEILCVIPARGGSKSVLKKNLRLVGDKPLVAHTIDLAISIPEFDAVCLSSDDPEILKHATGRCLEIVRPDELSDDRATTESVVLHALGALKKHNFE